MRSPYLQQMPDDRELVTGDSPSPYRHPSIYYVPHLTDCLLLLSLSLSLSLSLLCLSSMASCIAITYLNWALIDSRHLSFLSPYPLAFLHIHHKPYGRLSASPEDVDRIRNRKHTFNELAVLHRQYIGRCTHPAQSWRQVGVPFTSLADSLSPLCPLFQ